MYFYIFVLLYFFPATLCPGGGFVLVAGRNCERVDERAAAWAVVSHRHAQIEIEDVRRSEPAAGVINREHRVAIDFVESMSFNTARPQCERSRKSTRV